MVEQGTHKPLVGSSNLPPGSFMNGLGLHSRRLKRSLFTLDRASIWTRGSRSIFAVIQQQPSVWERSLKSWRKRRCQHSQMHDELSGS